MRGLVLLFGAFLSCTAIAGKASSSPDAADKVAAENPKPLSKTAELALDGAKRKPAGPQPPYVAGRADSYAISVDTDGKLRWSNNDLDGDHLICVVTEHAPSDYLDLLRGKNISYVVSGALSVDLARAVHLLREHFGIRTLLLEGGGHINGGFLEAGVVDEVSLLLLPGIDGRHDIPAVFDGVVDSNRTAIPLKLKSVEQREGGALWIRYEVLRA